MLRPNILQRFTSIASLFFHEQGIFFFFIVTRRESIYCNEMYYVQNQLELQGFDFVVKL